MAFRETNFPKELLSSGEMLYDDLFTVVEYKNKNLAYLILTWFNHLNIFSQQKIVNCSQGSIFLMGPTSTYM
jgi:hypothetical protein